MVVKKIIVSVYDSSGIRIHADRIRLSFPLKLSVRELSLTDEAPDTLAYVGRLHATIRPWPLLNGQISITGIHLENARIDTKSLIEGMEINAVAGNLQIEAGLIRPAQEEISLRRLELSETDVTLRIDSTATADTSRTANRWKCRSEKIHLQHVSFTLRIPADSIRMVSSVEDLLLTGSRVDFGAERYGVMQLLLSDASVGYDTGNRPAKTGLDLSHMAFSGISAGIDSFFWQGRETGASVRTFSATERSGLVITSMQGDVRSDTALLSIPRWSVQTPYSAISAQAAIPWDALAAQPQAAFQAQLTASLGRQDVLLLAGEWGKTFGRSFPTEKLTVAGLLEGNADKLYLRRLQSEWPGAFRIDANGLMEKVMSPVHRSGKFHLTASVRGGKHLLPEEYAGRFSLPDSLWLNVQAALEREEYRTEMHLSEQQGNVWLAGRYHAGRKEYALEIKADSLALNHFLPGDSIPWLTASLRAEGRGTDLYADSTRLRLEGALTEMRYRNTRLSDISLDGSLRNHHLQATLAGNSPEISGSGTLDGTVRPEKLAATLIMDMDSLDLYRLNLADRPLSGSFQIFSEMETDLKERHQLDVTLGNWMMATENRTVNPKTVTLLADCNEDTTHISFHTGDLAVMLMGNAGVKNIIHWLNAVAGELNRQMKEDTVIVPLSQPHPSLPGLRLQIEAARDNPVYDYLQENDIFFDRFSLDASLSPERGLQAQALLLALVKDTTRIDTVRLNVWHDTLGLQHAGHIVKQRFRRQEPFTAGWKGFLRDRTAGLELYYRNRNGETGLQLGVRAERQPDGINMQLLPGPVIAFLPFTVNDDNYVRVKNERDISANLRLTGEDNASVWLHSMEEDGRIQELLLEINQIGLDRITGGFAGMPSMQGLSNLSLRYVPVDDTYMMVADMGVNDLTCQGEKVGDVLLNGVYLPLDEDRNQVDAHLFHNGKEISSLSALYQPAGGGRLNGVFEINQWPLATLNPFLAGTARLNGALQGSATIAGTAEKPLLNGYLRLDTATAYVTAADTRLRFDTQRVEIRDSRIGFHTYGIYAAGDKPFVIDGTIDLRNPVRGTADLNLTASNMQLLNAGKNRESIVYGKMFVDLNSTVKGPLNALAMRGNLRLLGNTNMTCILRTSPLTVQNRLDDLITFSYFRDTLPHRDRREWMRTPREFVSIEGLDMLLTIRMEPAVKLKIDLDEDASGRIELEGGGDLSFQYTPQKDMLLTGRYTLSGGLIRYNMPVISHKTLRIKENSHIEWTGDPMNPWLNLKATERFRSYVSTDGQTPHVVNFDAGIELKHRVEDLALQFTLDAPDDAAVQDQLTAMGAEERGKQAVSMLLTGMYLAGDGTGTTKFDMGTAINSFLQNEINHITGNLLTGVDFNFGMESYDGTAYGTGWRTNYSFRFSKRFYNDRLNVILGGLVSAGDVASENNSFINDASIEYRLDAGGSRYARIFYNRQYESMLEGEITKYGAGVVFRRKMRRLLDLFTFRKKHATASQ
jgi:hypothetical protein